MTAVKKPLADAGSTERSTLAVASVAQGPMAMLFWAIFLYTYNRFHRTEIVPGVLSAVIGLSAVVCGLLALRELRKHSELRGRWLAIAGIVLGVIPLLTVL